MFARFSHIQRIKSDIILIRQAFEWNGTGSVSTGDGSSGIRPMLAVVLFYRAWTLLLVYVESILVEIQSDSGNTVIITDGINGWCEKLCDCLG